MLFFSFIHFFLYLSSFLISPLFHFIKAENKCLIYSIIASSFLFLPYYICFLFLPDLKHLFFPFFSFFTIKME